MFAKKENKIKAQLSSSFSQEKHSYKPTEPVEKFNICLRLTLQAFQLDWINLDFTRWKKTLSMVIENNDGY